MLPKSGGGGLHEGRHTAKKRGREYPKTFDKREGDNIVNIQDTKHISSRSSQIMPEK